MIIDPIQILLIFDITTLTVLLFIIGLEVFQILKELKRTLEKVNRILDDTGRITNSIATPVEEASEFLVGLKKGVSFLNSVSKFFKDKNSQKKIEEIEEIEEEREEEEKKEKSSESKKKSVSTAPSAKSSANKKRFFTRKGKSLRK